MDLFDVTFPGSQEYHICNCLRIYGVGFRIAFQANRSDRLSSAHDGEKDERHMSDRLHESGTLEHKICIHFLKKVIRGLRHSLQLGFGSKMETTLSTTGCKLSED